MEDNKKFYGERINYVFTENCFVGHSVNLPIIVQAKTLEEMKKNIKILAQSWVNKVQSIIDNDEFDFVEYAETHKPPTPLIPKEDLRYFQKNKKGKV